MRQQRLENIALTTRTSKTSGTERVINTENFRPQPTSEHEREPRGRLRAAFQGLPYRGTRRKAQTVAIDYSGIAKSFHVHKQLAGGAWHPAAAAAAAAVRATKVNDMGSASQPKPRTSAFRGFRDTETRKQNKISTGNSFANKLN